MAAPFTVDVPGAFDSFFGGTGVMAGDPYSRHAEQQRGADELRAAWLAGTYVRRGKGHSIRLTLPSLEAVVVLAEYADACLAANSDEPDYSEVRAARAILERVGPATDGRVTYDGWAVRLDGEQVPL